MAVVLGTNAGFVSSAPSSDPSGSSTTMDGYRVGQKDISPEGTYKVTELGWWQDATSTAAAAYKCGIYSHDAVNDKPNAPIATVSTGQSVAENTAGWYKYQSLNIELTTKTTYWICVACANTGSATTNFAASATNARYSASTGGDLPNPWGTDAAISYTLAFYALYEVLVVGQPTSKRFGGVPFVSLFSNAGGRIW